MQQACAQETMISSHVAPKQRAAHAPSRPFMHVLKSARTLHAFVMESAFFSSSGLSSPSQRSCSVSLTFCKSLFKLVWAFLGTFFLSKSVLLI